MKVSLITEPFIPNVIFCNHFSQGMNLPKEHKLGSRFIYDYEIELVTNCDGGYMIENDEKVAVQKGTLIFRRPGEKTRGVMRYSSYILCFDHKKNSRILKTEYDLMKAKSYQKTISHPLIDHLPRVSNTRHYARNLNMFKEILNAYINPHIGSVEYLNAIVIQILYHMNQENHEIILHSHKKSEDIKGSIQYIECNLDKDLSLEVLSKQLHLSPTYYHQLFTKIVGVTPKKFVIRSRINAAKDLLIHTDYTVNQITDAIGFTNATYFSHAFKREVQLTPLKYREKNQLSF